MTKTKKKTIPVKTHGQHTGVVGQTLKFNAIDITQSGTTLYAFKAKASSLYGSLSTNRRIEDKDEGYQRTLSPARVQAITRYITQQKKPIPGAVIVCLDKASFDRKKGELTIPPGKVDPFVKTIFGPQ